MPIINEEDCSFELNEIQNAVLQNVSSDPSVSKEGQIFWRNDTHRPRVSVTSADKQYLVKNNDDVIHININPTSATTDEGDISWNSLDHTLDVGLENGSILQVGQENQIRALNNTGSPMVEGTVVYISGSQGQRATIAKASASDLTGDRTIGVLTQDVNDNATTYVTTFGLVRNANTLGIPEGSPIYLSTSAGLFTSATPVAPNYHVQIGYCIRQHATQGQIFVSIHVHEKLVDASDVQTSTLSAGDSLLYDGTKWINRNSGNITREYTGFKNPELVTISYDQATRKITLGGTVEAYYRSNLVPTISAGHQSTAHSANVSATQFYYHNGTDFVWSSIPWTFDMVQIASVVYAPNGQFIFSVRESHGLMQWQTHKECHELLGAYITSGGDLSNYVTGSTTAANRRPFISSTLVNDEDLQTTNAALSTNSYSLFNLSAASTMVFTKSAADIISLSGNQPYYNQYNGSSWVQTLFPVNAYGAIFVFAVPSAADSESQSKRFVFVQPQIVDTTLSNIQALSPSSVNLNGLSSLNPEIVFIAKIIVRYFASNWTITSVEKLTGSKVTQTSTGSGYLSSVTISPSLSGNGTVASPLGLTSATTPGTYSTVIVDSFGRVTSGSASGGSTSGNYVSKTGDTMSGTLSIVNVSGNSDSLIVSNTSASNISIDAGSGSTSAQIDILSDATKSSFNALSTTSASLSNVQFLAGDGFSEVKGYENKSGSYKTWKLGSTNGVTFIKWGTSGSEYVGILPQDYGTSAQNMATREWVNAAYLPILNPTVSGKLTLLGSFTSGASLNIGAMTVSAAPSSPVDGDIFQNGVDILRWRAGSNTRTIGLREVSQTWGGTQTFGTVASTSTITGRSHPTTQQSNTPTGVSYTWTLTTGNALILTLTSTSASPVTITTASPTAGASSFLSIVGHASATRDLAITQSGVTFVMTGKTSGSSITLDTIPINGRAHYQLYWQSATVCFITRMALV